MHNIIRISEHREGRVLCRYRNIICLISNRITGGENKIILNFYDAYMKQIVDLCNWKNKLESLKIIDINYLKSNIFIVAVYQERTILVCLDLHTYTYQECEILQHAIDFNEISLQNNGSKMYIGIQSRETSCWNYTEVIKSENCIFLRPINFLNRHVNELKVYNSCFDIGVFQCIDDRNIKNNFSYSNTLFTYNGKNADIVLTEHASIEYITVCNNRIYYEIIKNGKEQLFCYDPIEKHNAIVPRKSTEYIVPSYENDIFFYTETYILRVSDNKKIFVSEILDSFKTCNEALLCEVPLFPDCWCFYDDWLVAELDAGHCFVYNLNSMTSYYFENVIDIDKDTIYLYERPFYYMN